LTFVFIINLNWHLSINHCLVLSYVVPTCSFVLPVDVMATNIAGNRVGRSIGEHLMNWCGVIASIVVVIIAVLLSWPSPTSPVSYSLGDLPTFPSTGLAQLRVMTRDNVTQIAKGLLTAAEAIVFDKHGNMYAGCADGRIIRIKMEHLEAFATAAATTPTTTSSIIELITYTGDYERAKSMGLTCGTYAAEPVCGRPLGMEFDSENILLVADAYYGLVSVDVIERTVTILTNSISVGNSIRHPADDDIQIKDATLAAEYRSIKMNDSVSIRFANCVARGKNGYIYFTDSSDR
jgi:hypothetical protein